jgi:hypothetical protein
VQPEDRVVTRAARALAASFAAALALAGASLPSGAAAQESLPSKPYLTLAAARKVAAAA